MKHYLKPYVTDKPIELSDRRYTLGRAESCDFVLQDPNKLVSRYHAEIRVDNGNAHIRDLGSKNGTFVSGERISQGYRELEDRDVITLSATGAHNENQARSFVYFSFDNPEIPVIDESREGTFGRLAKGLKRMFLGE